MIKCFFCRERIKGKVKSLFVSDFIEDGGISREKRVKCCQECYSLYEDDQ